MERFKTWLSGGVNVILSFMTDSFSLLILVTKLYFETRPFVVDKKSYDQL